MRTLTLCFIALAACVTPAAAQATDVATFLEKWESLQRRGPLALFSKDLKGAVREIKDATARLRAERLAAVAAGRTPAYCPPSKGGLDKNELLAAMQAVPPARRARTEVSDALRAGLARKYPCAR